MSTAAETSVLLPVGRMVSGSLYKPRTTDRDGKPLMIKNGPNAGKPRVDYALGYAIVKEAGHTAWWQTAWGLQIYNAANASNPNAVALAVAEGQAGRDMGKFFAFKIVDGDSTIPNEAGKAPNTVEHYRGHWILWLGSSYAPRIVNKDGSAPIVEPDVVKCGHFIQAYISVKPNDSAQSPGIYLNHGYIAHAGFGPEIASGPDPKSLGFGAGPLPPGASAVPVGTMTPPAAVPGLPAPGAALPAPPGIPAPVVAAPVLPPVTAVVPHAAILAPPGAPPPPAAPAAPVVPVAPVMTAKAAGATYEQFKANGWNDDQLRQNGYIV